MKTNKRACFLVHGFGGGEEELAPLKDRLMEDGRTAVCARLAGHTGRRRDLSKTTGEAWIASAQEQYGRAREEYGEMDVVGFSMGGLILTRLIQAQGAGRAVFINTPIWFWNFGQMGRNLRTDFSRYSRYYLRESFNKPIRSDLEFVRLLHMLRREFGTVRCPALVIQALDDDTAQSRSGAYIYEQLAGKKELLLLKNGGHDLLRGPAGSEACERVLAFLSKEEEG